MVDLDCLGLTVIRFKRPGVFSLASPFWFRVFVGFIRFIPFEFVPLKATVIFNLVGLEIWVRVFWARGYFWVMEVLNDFHRGHRFCFWIRACRGEEIL